jgi:hypothetical protein
MRPAAAALALYALLAQNGSALPQASTQDMTLVLPQPLVAGQTAWLEVQLGAIGRGQEIGVATNSGQQLGVISSPSVRLGQEAGTHALPVPADAIRDGRLSIRLTITESGATRAPTAQEVRSVKLKVATVPR